MGIFRHFPYTNFHDLNLDWLLNSMKWIVEEWERFTVDWGKNVKEEVDNWLEEHPEATTTVLDNSLTADKFTEELRLETLKDYITPDMFGAVGDGVTNDYKAFLDCALFAKLNDKIIVVPHKSYYLDGDTYPEIELYCDVICLDSEFIIGDSHFRQSKPVFKYIHENEIEQVNGVIANFLINNSTVADNYADKFFILDTKIEYGTAVSANAPNDETIKECIFTRNKDTSVMFSDDITSRLPDNASALHVSDMNETGFEFSGARIKQKTENGYGVCFMYISRNNMYIHDIQIECNNALGSSSVFLFENANNITVKNIVSYSKQPSDIWTYEMSFYYCANVLVENFKANSLWSTIATRGLKNYTVKDSILTTFDGHWNAFGNYICDNNILYNSAHIGYGKGLFIIRNTKCKYVATRIDYVQIWQGEIVIDNVQTETGLWINTADDHAQNYNAFFNKFKVPKVIMKNLTGITRPLYIRISDSTKTRIDGTSEMTIESMNLSGVSVPYNNIVYDAVLSNVPFATGSRSTLAMACNIIMDSRYAERSSLSPSNFTNIVGGIQKQGNIINISFTGLNSETCAAWSPLLTIPSKYKPTVDQYCVASVGDTVQTFFISGASGSVMPTKAINNTGERISFSISYMLTWI